MPRRPATARHGLRTRSDLRRPGRYRYRRPAENEHRFQGAEGVLRVDGLDFTFVPLAIDRRYEALDSGRVDVVDVFSTAGRLARSKVLRRQGPGFARTPDAVSARLTDEALRAMNAAVDLDGRRPEAVARDFLREQDLR